MKYFLLVGISCASLAFSQTKGSVGINTNTPKSTLDVNGNNNSSPTEIVGLQIPRTTRAEITAKNTLYGNNQIGTMIYITDISGGDADKSSPRKHMTKTGVYQLTNTINGLEWWRIFSIDEAEYMYKDDGTLPEDRIVTMNSKTLTFKTQDEAKVIFNNSTPTASVLTLASPIRIIDGGQGADNKVLTSDAAGNATWQEFRSRSIRGKLPTRNGIKVQEVDKATYIEASISLPPGKWVIYAGSTIVIEKNDIPGNDGSYKSGYKFYMYLSDTPDGGSTTMDITPDSPNRGRTESKSILMSGNIRPFLPHDYFQGQQIIKNSSNNIKTYYVKMFVPSDSRFGPDTELKFGNKDITPRTIRLDSPFAPMVGEKFLYAVEIASK